MLRLVDAARVVERERLPRRPVVVLGEHRTHARALVRVVLVVVAARLRPDLVTLVLLRQVDILEHLRVVIELVAVLADDGLVGERQHDALTRLEVVHAVPDHGAGQRRRRTSALVAAAEPEQLAHLILLVVARRLRREARGGLALRLARRLHLLLLLLAHLLLRPRLHHPRRRAVHLLARELLTERLALELLVEEALAAGGVELLPHGLLGLLLGKLPLPLLAIHLGLRLL